jgi:hypothetical protein
MTSLPWGLLPVTSSKLVPKIQLSCSTVPARGSLRATGSVSMTSASSLVNVSVASWGGTVLDKPYNHYSLLATIEDIFALHLLWYAGAPGLTSFGPDVFNSKS